MFTEPITNDEILCVHANYNCSSLDSVRIHDHPFKGNMMPRTTEARSLLATILIHFEAFEQATNARKRKRRLADQRLFAQQVEAVLCEVLCRELTTPHEWLAIPFSHRFLGKKGDRYAPSILTEKMVYVIKTLAQPELGLLDLVLGQRDFLQPSQSCLTVFKAAPQLVHEIERLGLSLDDFVTSLDVETVVLKAPKATSSARAVRIDYADDLVTKAYRQEMMIINTWLHQADIRCLPSSDEAVIDVSRRTLTRTFSNGSFVQCGRLFGGFWIEMRKPQRLERLRIDGKRIVEGDQYNIFGLEGSRQGLKKMFSAMLHDIKPRTSYPHGFASMFPKRTKVGEVIRRISEAHPRVAQHFGTGIGMHLMFKESEIMVDLLLALKQMGIVALPVHDAVLVPEGTEASVMRVMVDTFHRHTGIQGVVVKG
jgi:hypothetical protein